MKTGNPRSVLYRNQLIHQICTYSSFLNLYDTSSSSVFTKEVNIWGEESMVASVNGQTEDADFENSAADTSGKGQTEISVSSAGQDSNSEDNTVASTSSTNQHQVTEIISDGNAIVGMEVEPLPNPVLRYWCCINCYYRLIESSLTLFPNVDFLDIPAGDLIMCLQRPSVFGTLWIPHYVYQRDGHYMDGYHIKAYKMGCLNCTFPVGSAYRVSETIEQLEDEEMCYLLQRSQVNELDFPV